MTSAANRNKEVMLARETHADDYVGSASTARDQGRSAIDHGIRNRASGVIAVLPRAQHRAPNGCSQFLKRREVHETSFGGWRQADPADALSGLRRSKVAAEDAAHEAHCQADFKGGFEEHDEVLIYFSQRRFSGLLVISGFLDIYPGQAYPPHLQSLVSGYATYRELAALPIPLAHLDILLEAL